MIKKINFERSDFVKLIVSIPATAIGRLELLMLELIPKSD
jgi:hypothetical protein